MRIAIVDDLELSVELLRRLLLFVPDCELAWIAGNGAEAVEKCAQDTPDLILMDLVMPVMDGVEATRRIMQSSPCAILIVTKSVDRRAGEVFQAMGNGALDVVDTPSIGDGGDELLHKIATVGKLIGTSQQRRSRATADQATGPVSFDVLASPLAAIGASTGGPMALATLLAKLPDDFSACVIIVQHVDAEFAEGLVSWLGGQTGLPVEIAVEGTSPQRGKVLLGGRDQHLIMGSDQRLAYTPEPAALSYRPSVDVFFESLAQNWSGTGTAALLTGMGRDGARGLLALKTAGWYTVAQDESTSVVYGMPRAAAELGAATEILPLADIGDVLAKRFSRSGRRQE